jgi:hypothetical protein
MTWVWVLTEAGIFLSSTTTKPPVKLCQTHQTGAEGSFPKAEKAGA